MKALIIGATGATGKDLLQYLLEDSDYSSVVIFVRRSSGITHPKLSEIITDFDKLEEVSENINGDVWFSCLGTTLKAAGTKEKQRHIDYEIPASFADIAKRNGISTVVLLSAYGAKSTSNVFYSKLKGELENKIISLRFNKCIIFKPGLLQRKDTDRFGEHIIANVLNFLSNLGLVKRFRPMPTSILANKLAKSPKTLSEGTHTIELEKIFDF